MNAVTTAGYSKTLGPLDVGDCVAALIEETRRVRRGDLGSPEAMLVAQAITLNAMFTQLAYQASKMTLLEQIDRFTRLAFKAQAQCRATIEVLSLMKNPPTVFARQANIAHGPQQVNNGTPPSSRADDSESAPNELLEAPRERMDCGPTCAAGTSDQELAAVGTRDGATKRRG